MRSNRIKAVLFLALVVAALVILGGSKGAAYASSAPGGRPNLPPAVPTSTFTPGRTEVVASPTPAGIPSPLPTGGPTVVVTDCPNPFVDISNNVFYGAIHALNCAGVISGTDPTHYSPADLATRAQFAKIVVKGFSVQLLTITDQSFTDVPPSHYAYLYIESGLAAGLLSGYTEAQCAAAGAVHPCYQPNKAITRAELTRLVINATHYPLISPPNPTFADVPTSNFAYAYIETAQRKGVVHGVDANHFAPNRNIRRDEMAQIIYEGIITP